MYKSRLLSALVIVAGITACGQKGPLFLPGDPGQVRSEVPAADGLTGPDDEQRDDGEDDDQRR